VSARIKPHKVRGRELEEVREKDPDGRIVCHHRTVDTLGKMLRSGTIDEAMHDAAKDFQAAFIVANLDPLRAIPILRVPGTGREPELNERQLDARRRVHEAMQALGGISSPAGSCVWHVVGLQRASGPSVRAGPAGRCGRSRRRGFWLRRWGCWRHTSGMARPGGPPEGCLCILDGGFQIEEQKSAVAIAIVVRDPELALG
jgi:hypothetical protein